MNPSQIRDIVPWYCLCARPSQLTSVVSSLHTSQAFFVPLLPSHIQHVIVGARAERLFVDMATHSQPMRRPFYIWLDGPWQTQRDRSAQHRTQPLTLPVPLD